MKRFTRLLLPVLMAMVLALLNVIPVAAATTADVTITATPEYLAMTNSEATWAIGAVVASTSYWWTAAGTAPAPEPFEADDMKSIITNTGSVSSNIGMHAHDFTGGVGWVLHGTVPGENIVVLSAGITGCTNEAAMLDFVDTTPQELAHALAAAGTVKWCMLLKTGTFTDGVEKTNAGAPVTLTITKHT